jgi:hypothetical protein
MPENGRDCIPVRIFKEQTGGHHQFSLSISLSVKKIHLERETCSLQEKKKKKKKKKGQRESDSKISAAWTFGCI